MPNIKIHSVVTLQNSLGRILIVEYPEGCFGTDDSIGFLWFDESDLSQEENAIQYPGDRVFLPTPEETINNAFLHLSV